MMKERMIDVQEKEKNNRWKQTKKLRKLEEKQITKRL